MSGEHAHIGEQTYRPGSVAPRLLVGYAGLWLADRVKGLSAKKPGFVIIGTGRCGTNYVADYLTQAGVACGHERSFTPHGPLYRDGAAQSLLEGDSSWLAVPFLPQEGIAVLHQTRSPLSVIKSFHKLGFFDGDHYDRHKPFVDFARRYFEFSGDPLRSAMRWYIEWNEKCLAITDKRFQLEKFHESTGMISEWLGLESPLPKLDIPTDTNAKRSIVETDHDAFFDQVAALPEYSQLIDISARMGYEL